jgi:hypothetical protein
MKRARFTEEQIVTALKEYEAGAKAADLARKRRISEATSGTCRFRLRSPSSSLAALNHLRLI